ncbi:MAG: hypothetical protein WA421_19010 [Nitrososphaeraceae archaeon]
MAQAAARVQVGPGGGNAGASRKNEGCFIRFCRIVKPLIRVSCIITNNIACVLKSSCLLQKYYIANAPSSIIITSATAAKVSIIIVII